MAASAMSGGLEVLHLADAAPSSPKQPAVVFVQPASPKPISSADFPSTLATSSSRPASVVITTSTSVRRGSQALSASIAVPSSPKPASTAFSPASRLATGATGRRALHRTGSHSSLADDTFSFMSDRQILADIAARRYDAQRITRKVEPPMEPLWLGGGRGGAGRKAPAKAAKPEQERALGGPMGVSLFDVLDNDEEPKKKKFLGRVWQAVLPRRVEEEPEIQRVVLRPQSQSGPARRPQMKMTWTGNGTAGGRSKRR